MRSLCAMALLLAAAQPAAAEHAAPSTRVEVEVFTVGLMGDGPGALAFTREREALVGGVNPDDRSRELAARSAGKITLIHSTSWRWEPDGRIVLTYLAWAATGTLGRSARTVPNLAPPGPTDPLHPRPAEIRELDPLAHGLRHLAFLLRTSKDGAVAAALGPGAAAAIGRFAPDVAGELP